MMTHSLLSPLEIGCLCLLALGNGLIWWYEYEEIRRRDPVLKGTGLASFVFDGVRSMRALSGVFRLIETYPCSVVLCLQTIIKYSP